MLLFPFSDPAADRGSPLKSQHIAFLSEMEEDEEEDAVPTQISLISQDGTEQVSLSQEELQALGSAIGVVAQSGVLAVPEGGDTGTVAVASRDGTEAQEVQTELGLPLLPLLEGSCIFF
ncbi:hypothetical protein EK904_012928 [Melospiza melodia maxima]|nr:hypothetical protein EK904_012928 [Melospiza melodia maxima]